MVNMDKLAVGKRMGARAGYTASVLAGLTFELLGALIIYQTAADSKLI